MTDNIPPRPTPPIPPQKTSLAQVLRSIADGSQDERISIRMLLEAMDGRAFGALLLLFALPNVLPAPPGTSGILGLPLIFLTLQMMLGRDPWLPKVIADRSMPRTGFVSLVDRINPWLDRAEKLTAPRLQSLMNDRTEQIIGGFCLILAIVLVLPIPLGNMMPSFAICLIALGLLARDGLWVLAGLLTGVASLVIVSGVVYALIKAALFIIMKAFAG
ncbi:exopolysaccharide synthesis, ExoD [Ketogulonicigenium robustum]|uniref:Exopolysaccharide synthesis, ExoD n=1 Tax=Ketogulonicigenium robustum TaxID=92947 RepID=A0A1W6P1H5_9RHOB|nr:exopolysaccharide biosynthesis protein [Ketogulonicigenium robustum]ARO15137.1 exopolysaccharide synthesis, ExoD [Ketogulonicigenium robustum]